MLSRRGLVTEFGNGGELAIQALGTRPKSAPVCKRFQPTSC